jgi:carboxylate-amine ligase
MPVMTRTVGVEEEFLLVDPASGEAAAMGTAVLRAADEGADLTGELQREQVETGTRPCLDLGDLGRELQRTREQAREAARAAGAELAPLGTSPLPVRPTVSPGPRYQRMVARFGMTTSEQLTCGCHVHVGIGSEEEGVAALDRMRPWLAPLLALSANSPFWNGEDSGYASFRSQVWARGPSAGPTGLFGSAAGYRDVTETMLGTDTLLDDGMLYFDARLSRAHPTLEVRVPDVCREPDDAVLIAALVRALVDTGVREWREDRPPDPVRTEVLRLAAWRAGRSGLDGSLVDPPSRRPAPAADVLRGLVDHVAPALEESGDLDLVRELLRTVLKRNTGAARQREVLLRSGDMAAVVADAVSAVG